MASPSFGVKAVAYTYTLPYTIFIIKHVVKNTVHATFTRNVGQLFSGLSRNGNGAERWV
jgi:hypothetical protein